jgi:hypothetical protein
MELARQFTRLLEFVKQDQHAEICGILLGFAQNKTLGYSFREGFFDACIEIRMFSKDEDSASKLHMDVLNLKIEEAEEKGTHSKLVLAGLLENALDYCFTYVKNGKIIEDLKKRITGIDYSDELVAVELPEDVKKELNEKFRKYDEQVRKAVSEYIEKLKGNHPIQILYNILNDESIFRMNVENTKDFTHKLLKQSISNLFTTSLDVKFKRKKIESQAEKFEFRLHENLLNYLDDTMRLIYYITSRLQTEKIMTANILYDFLSNCEIISETDIQIITKGILRHFAGDYISSVSILTPKIESTLFLYLDRIKADVSTYRTSEISQRLLGGLIELPEVKGNFSIDFQYFMKLLLVADDSVNFRNRLSHGGVNISELNQKTSLIVIFLILKICAKTFKITK